MKYWLFKCWLILITLNPSISYSSNFKLYERKKLLYKTNHLIQRITRQHEEFQFLHTVLPYFSYTNRNPVVSLFKVIRDICKYKRYCKINPFFSTLQVVPVMPPCVTSAMSVGNLNQIRDGNGTSAVSQSNNNNNSINSGNINNINNNNNNRVSSAVSAGNVSKIHTAKVTGELNVLSMMCFLRVFMCAISAF